MAKKRLILFFALVAILAFAFFPGFLKYRKLMARQSGLEKRIEKLEEENRRLEEEKYKLENDIEYVEKRAREKLGIVKEDEIPYRIIDGQER
ncbi:MAG: cell division protein FtsL [Candidatus Omnitrophica bacterium]|nr:cell division protein FtsL [Candidatus Omnitrophota bacterium]